jgi:adenylate kinase
VASPSARVVLLGKQGAGKGTQAERVGRHYQVPHLSTGDVFRAAVRSGTPFGERAKAFLDAGELVPDEVVIGVVQERLAGIQGFVLDGFPRTVHQAEALKAMLSPAVVDVVVNLDVDTPTVLARLASRRVCVECGATYNIFDSPPAVAEHCDRCGGLVVQRADDTEAAISRRLELYERETAPLVAWYECEGLLVHVDADGTPDEVTGQLVAAIDERRAASSAPR